MVRNMSHIESLIALTFSNQHPILCTISKIQRRCSIRGIAYYCWRYEQNVDRQTKNIFLESFFFSSETDSLRLLQEKLFVFLLASYPYGHFSKQIFYLLKQYYLLCVCVYYLYVCWWVIVTVHLDTTDQYYMSPFIVFYFLN